MSRLPHEVHEANFQHGPLLWHPSGPTTSPPLQQPQSGSRQPVLFDTVLMLNAFHSPKQTMPALTQPLSILPLPQHILKSQSTGRCEVCGKVTCTLITHKYFTKEAKLKQRLPLESPRAYHSPATNIHISQPSSVQYPVAMDEERRQLLSLWSRGWGGNARGPQRHLLPVRWIDNVLPAAMKHAPLFQSLLATSAAICAFNDPSMVTTATRHMHLAIQMLSSPSQQSTTTTDEFLLASICILYVFTLQGNEIEIDERFADIAHRVSLRGGPHYLGFSGAVADVLLHIDATIAVFRGRVPAFELPLPALKVGVAARSGAAFCMISRSTSLNPALLAAADSLCRATDIFELSYDINTTPSGSMNSFGYLSTVSEYQLARCYSVSKGSRTWDEVLCLTLLLFNRVVLHNHGSVDVPTQRIEHQLWETLETMFVSGDLDTTTRNFAMWVLMTGLTTSVHTQSRYRSIGISRLRLAQSGVAFTGWNAFREQVLDQYLWMAAAQEEVFRDIWLEVEGRKLALPVQSRRSS